MVATMPLLRAKELSYVVTKAKIALALCDARLADEMEKTRPLARELERIVYWGNGELEALMAKPGYESFTACDTASDDVCLIAFTSGTTGEPKGTMHFQRDMLASCDSYSQTRAASRSATTASSARRRSPSRSGSAGTCCSRSASARPRSSSRRRRPTCCCRRSRNTARPSASRRRPPIARCWASLPSTTSRRCANASRPARRCRRRRSRPGRRRPA